jgi:hypothetical protein
VNCTRQSCPGRAVWRPVLAMKSSVKSPVTEGKFGLLCLCEQHKDEARLTDFISNSTWDKIARYMREAGKQEPKRSLTTLTWEMVDSPASSDAETLPF